MIACKQCSVLCVVCCVLLSCLSQVRLLVVDSVTFHFRQDMKDFSARARVLTGMAQQLMQIAEHFKIAVSDVCVPCMCRVVLHLLIQHTAALADNCTL